MSPIMSLAGEECWKMLKSGVGTLKSASSEASSNNDPQLDDSASVDADTGKIDFGFEDSPDGCTRSIVEGRTRKVPLFELVPPEKLANFAVEGFGHSG